MAAASGQHQDTNTKKEITPQQRQLFMGLGVAGALALLAGGLFMTGVIGGGGGSATTPTTATASVSPSSSRETGATTTSPGASGLTSGISPSGASAAGIGAGVPATTTLVPQAVQRFRPDPFQQAYFIPTPVPTLPPVPPPVPIPAPADVEPIFVPGIPGGNAELQRPLNLPPVKISRLDEALRRPSSPFPPRRTLGGPGGAGLPSPSYDKRLSGVVIADGVRAILETQGPAGPVSRVVQPGDEVDGITILNIQRFNDGTKTVTRMLIRENGEERTVELRAGAPINAASDSSSSSSSGSSGFPSGGFRSGGFPGG